MAHELARLFQLFDIMQEQLSLPLDRKVQNGVILSMKSAIEERIRHSSVIILQSLHAHFCHDHHERQSQPRRASATSTDMLPTPTSATEKKLSADANENSTVNTANHPNNGSTIKVSALVAHYSGGESSSVTNVSVFIVVEERALRSPPCLFAAAATAAAAVRESHWPTIGTCADLLFLLQGQGLHTRLVRCREECFTCQMFQMRYMPCTITQNKLSNVHGTNHG